MSDSERREAAFREFLRSGDDRELRAMGESTASNGGYLAAPEWENSVVVALREFDTLYGDFELLRTETGAAMTRPSVDTTSQVAVQAGNDPLGSGISEQTAPVFGQVSYSAYTFPALFKVSRQLVADAIEGDFDSFLQARLAEIVGRALGRAAGDATGSYGSGTSQPQSLFVAANAYNSASQIVTLTAATKVPMFPGDSTTTELIGNVLSPNSLRKMLALVDPSYRSGAAWYFNALQHAALLGAVDANGLPLIPPNGPQTLWGFPIKVSNSIPNLTASTVGGPVFGNLKAAMSLRLADLRVDRFDEFNAEQFNVTYRGILRADTRGRDLRALATVKPAAT